MGGLSAAAILAATPVPTWPLGVTGDDGETLTLGEALGPGGDEVERMLAAIRQPGPRPPAGDITQLAAATPGGWVDLPLEEVTLSEGVRRTTTLEQAWLADVDRCRSAPRPALAAAGRSDEVEAALHVAMLVATEALDPAEDSDVDAHVASGAQLWLLAGAVVWALSGGGRGANPFGPWVELIAAGRWPVGPSQGRLVLSVGGGR